MPVQFPDKVAPVFTPAPYKIIYGGRGKGASWSFARAALLLGSHRPLFIVCAREVQKSIRDSVHKLLSDQREPIGLQGFYDVLDSEIRGRNGTTFVFTGLNNINSVRSTEAIDILWVTEASHVPKSKWNVLLPTVRRDPPAGPFKKGSEIWIDFNPELTRDDTYQMFVVDPPTDAVVISMNYKDNPFFPQLLQRQMLDMRRKDYEEYLNVWEGRPRKTLSGAIYAKELGKAIEDGRISHNVKHDRSRPVIVSFDLGDDDMTAMWVWQQAGNEHYAIYYYENSNEDIGHYLQILQDKKYLIKRVLLPHDAEQSHQSARRLVHNTIAKQVKAAMPTPGMVKIVPRTSKVNRINAVRSLFSRVHINEIECDRGVMCLQHYQYDVDPVTGERSREPLHNWASHGADGFGYYAVWLKEGNKKERERDTGEEDVYSRVSSEPRNNSWLAT